MKRITLLWIILWMSSQTFGQQLAFTTPEKLSTFINTPTEEVFPLLDSSHTTLYFVRAFYNKNIGGQLGGQDIWYSQKDSLGAWTEAQNLSQLNSSLNNIVVGVSNDPNKLYLLNTYSPSRRWNFGIAYSFYENDKWVKPEEFPISFDVTGSLRGYYITPKEDVIFVSTENEDSYGSEDLYLYRLVNNEWVGPFHFDQSINTTGAEISPFLSEDYGALYFASEGHEGYGGFDIYMSERLDNTWENWSKPINLGETINTPGFEAFFSTYETGETFFSQSKDGKPADIYTSTADIHLANQNIKEMLAQSLFLQGKFKRALKLDTTINNDLLHIILSTPEIVKKASSILKWNNTINVRLFGLDERDSIINENITLQHSMDRRSSYFTELRLDNGALSEDINGIVNRNVKIPITMAGILSQIPDTDPDANEDDLTIIALKKDIAKEVVKNSTLKQEISALIGDNSLQKHSFSQLTEDKEPTINRIVSTNGEIETKIEEWVANMEALQQNRSKLIEATSKHQVYLTHHADKVLSEDNLTKRFEAILFKDTLINQHLAHLAIKAPEVSNLLSNNSEMNLRLFNVHKDDSLINKNVRALSGLMRASSQYEQLNVENDALNKDFSDIVASNATISKDLSDTLLNALNSNSSMLGSALKKQNIPEQIAKNMALKQNISELALQNVLLKESLILGNSTEDSTVSQIESNKVIMEEQMQEWEASIEELELSTLAFEKETSPDAYMQDVLDKSAYLNAQFKKALNTDSSMNQNIEQLIAGTEPLAPTLGTLTSSNGLMNHYLFDINGWDGTFNQNMTKLSGMDSTTQEYSTLLLTNSNLVSNIGTTLSEKADIPNSITVDVLQNSKASDGTIELEKQMALLLATNADIKQNISERINENAVLKHRFTKSGNQDATIADQIGHNNLIIQRQIKEWMANMDDIQEVSSKLRNAILLDYKTSDLLAESDSLDGLFLSSLTKDTTIIKQIARSSKTLSLPTSISSLALSNTTMNQGLFEINGLSIQLNQNTSEQILTNTSKTKRSGLQLENIDLADRIEVITSENSTLISDLDGTVSDTLNMSIDELMVKDAQIKQSIAKLVNRNAILKLHIGNETANKKTIDQIESNNLLIRQRIKAWAQNMESLQNIFSNKEESDDIFLAIDTTLSPDTKIEGYTVQVIAMPRDLAPRPSFFNHLDQEKIKMTKGKDGLDRYYIGKYESKNEALKVMRKLRKKEYSDAFVRAIVKYSIL